MINILLVIIGILLFGFIIFIHEFGHFITAKLSGVWVKEFALGMGPKIFGFRKGDTQYSLRLLPIGGFCDMEGESDGSNSDTSFSSKPVYKRMIIVVTGAIFNIVLGVVFMAIVLCQNKLLPTLTIADFTKDSLLQSAGAEVGDTLVSIDGYNLYSDKDLSFAYGLADPDNVDFVLERDGKHIELNDVKLSTKEINGKNIIALDFYIYGEEVNFISVVKKTFVDSYSIVRMVLGSVQGLFTGKIGLNELSGPVGVTQALTDAASQGLQTGFGDAVLNILFMMAVITINLGIFNLLPFPALDGGRFVLLIIEAIRRKPIPVKYESYINTAGFVILIGFMIVVAFKDIWVMIF